MIYEASFHILIHKENEKKNSYTNIYLHMNSGYEIVELENNKTSS